MATADTVTELALPPAPVDPPAHAVATGELLARLGAPDCGLTEAEAVARRIEYGPNELAEAPPLWRKIFAHLASEWILMLLLALTPVTVIEVSKLIRAWLWRADPATTAGE